jgi:hypothetical protein
MFQRLVVRARQGSQDSTPPGCNASRLNRSRSSYACEWKNSETGKLRDFLHDHRDGCECADAADYDRMPVVLDKRGYQARAEGRDRNRALGRQRRLPVTWPVARVHPHSSHGYSHATRNGGEYLLATRERGANIMPIPRESRPSRFNRGTSATTP